MKIEQKPVFQPITLTLETAAEAEILWAIIGNSNPKTEQGRELAIKISNWFSRHAQLGG